MEVNGVTRTAVMCLHYCLDAEKEKKNKTENQAALKFAGTTYQTNPQIPKEALPVPGRLQYLWQERGAQEEQHGARGRENKAKNSFRQGMKCKFY